MPPDDEGHDASYTPHLPIYSGSPVQRGVPRKPPNQNSTFFTEELLRRAVDAVDRSTARSDILTDGLRYELRSATERAERLERALDQAMRALERMTERAERAERALRDLPPTRGSGIWTEGTEPNLDALVRMTERAERAERALRERSTGGSMSGRTTRRGSTSIWAEDDEPNDDEPDDDDIDDPDDEPRIPRLGSFPWNRPTPAPAVPAPDPEPAPLNIDLDEPNKGVPGVDWDLDAEARARALDL